MLKRGIAKTTSVNHNRLVRHSLRLGLLFPREPKNNQAFLIL